MGRGERGDLSDAEWERLRAFLPVSNGWCGRWRSHRQVIDGVAADKAYSNGPCRQYLRRRGIRHTIPEKADSQAARLRKGS